MHPHSFKSFYQLSTLDVTHVRKDTRPSVFFMQPKMARAWEQGYAWPILSYYTMVSLCWCESIANSDFICHRVSPHVATLLVGEDFGLCNVIQIMFEHLGKGCESCRALTNLAW